MSWLAVGDKKNKETGGLDTLSGILHAPTVNNLPHHVCLALFFFPVSLLVTILSSYSDVTGIYG